MEQVETSEDVIPQALEDDNGPALQPEIAAEPVDLTSEGMDLPESLGSGDLLIAESVSEDTPAPELSTGLKAVIEAAIYVTDEPLSAEQIASAIDQPLDHIHAILQQLVAEYAAPDRGLSVREIAGGYKMSTKPEFHESIRRFVKRLQPPLKLSLAALETLAVVAYKQPITGPEILEIRGVQGAGVVKTLLDRRLIAAAGRKNVLGKPMMYKTTREFLVQFGLNSLAELPTLKEFEELGRLALSDSEEADPAAEMSDRQLTPVEESADAGESGGIQTLAAEADTRSQAATAETNNNNIDSGERASGAAPLNEGVESSHG